MGELRDGLEDVLDACKPDDNDVIALTVQEGSEERIVKDIEHLVSKTYAGWNVKHAFARGHIKVIRDLEETDSKNQRRKDKYIAYEKGHELVSGLYEVSDPYDYKFAEGVHLIVLHRAEQQGRSRSFAVDMSSRSRSGQLL